MSTTKTEAETEDVTLDEFESHRRNLRDREGIVSDINPVSKDKIRVDVELSHGDTEFSKTMITEEFNKFMTENNIKESRASDAILGEKVNVEYENGEWKLDYPSSNEESTVNHSFRVSMAKWTNLLTLLGSIISICLLFVIPTPTYILFTSLILVFHIVSSLYYQNAVGVAAESGSVDPSRRAVVTGKAYQTYQKNSLPRRVLDSMTMYAFS